MEFPATIMFVKTAASTLETPLMILTTPTSRPSRPLAYPLTACLFIIPLAGLRLVDTSAWIFSLNFVVDIHLAAILLNRYLQLVKFYLGLQVTFYICLLALTRSVCFQVLL